MKMSLLKIILFNNIRKWFISLVFYLRKYMRPCKLFFTTFICLLSSFVYAQLNKNFFNDSVIVVRYNNTNYLSQLKTTRIMKLIIDRDASYFFISNPDFKIEEEGKIPSIIKYIDSNKLLFNQPMMPKYDKYNYFSDSLYPMKWNLTGKKEVINGRVGYEATTFFRGRYFTAFYDPNIPFNNGPMKFGGLPGMIIRFYDKDRIFYYDLHSIIQEPRTFKVNKINWGGDYKTFLSIYPEWRRKLE
ncbi:MAG TPA: hypothetical protein DEU93_02745, partial [Chitinophagaceae bacterium]|nr:hypothetical protein [Chitinophagaceae bacterium]